MKTVALILAAGRENQMHSGRAKELHDLMGRTLLQCTLDNVHPAVDAWGAVLGHHAAELTPCLPSDMATVVQDFSLGQGTAKAAQAGLALLGEDPLRVLITAGDMPVISADSYRRLVDAVDGESCKAAVLYADAAHPEGCDRVLFDGDGNVRGVTEQGALLPHEEEIPSVNTGVYCFDRALLADALSRLAPQSDGAWHLSDVPGVLSAMGETVAAVPTGDPREALRIVTRQNLSEAIQYMKELNCEKHMNAGVTIIDPAATYIESDVEIGADTIIYPGCFLQNGTRIGQRCTLLPNSRLKNAIVEDDVTIESSVLLDCHVGSGTTVGPFAYLRPKADVGEGCRIGDFVEIKNSRIGNKTKVSHLTYVGDSDLGEDINLGCGVVFVNYDGKVKQRSVVEDHAFIGCNTNLVAPVHVGRYAYVAAGSTITEDVPEESLYIARSRGTVKENWVTTRKEQGKL